MEFTKQEAMDMAGMTYLLLATNKVSQNGKSMRVVSLCCNYCLLPQRVVSLMSPWHHGYSTIAIAEHSGQAEISSTGTTGPQYSLVSQRPALPEARASIIIG